MQNQTEQNDGGYGRIHSRTNCRPSLSIITVTYNADATIRSCLQSIAAQDIDLQHVIIDGGSNDATLEIVSECCLPGSIVISEPDNGIYDAMNKGLKFANGDVIGILNSDDVYHDNRVLINVLELFRTQQIDVCYGDLLYIDRSTKAVHRYWQSGEYYRRKWFYGWMPPHPTFFVRKEIYEKYGNFDLSLGSAADYEIMLRFLLKNQVRVAYLPEIIVDMSTGGVSNASVANRFRANRMDKKAWERNGLTPLGWTFLLKPLRKIPQWFVRPRDIIRATF